MCGEVELMNGLGALRKRPGREPSLLPPWRLEEGDSDLRGTGPSTPPNLPAPWTSKPPEL
jgi:hypothetical protein